MAMTEQPIVVGVFADRTAAEQAIQELKRIGLSNEQIKYSVQRGTEGILEGLVGMGIPYSEADFYNREFHGGRTIVAVKANQRQQEAYNILRLSGAYDAHERAAAGPSIDPHVSNEQTVQVREEQLQAQKRWVQTEEIRIHKKVITEEKIFKVSVSREEVYIERVPLNTPSTAPVPVQPNTVDPDDGSLVTLAPGQSIKLPVREERVVFQKVPMIIEEITLTKRLLQETKPITETVQRENVRLERSGNVHIQGDIIDTSPLTPTQTE